MNKNWHIKTRDETQRRRAVDFTHNFFRFSVITGLTLMADVVRFFFTRLAVIRLYTSQYITTFHQTVFTSPSASAWIIIQYFTVKFNSEKRVLNENSDDYAVVGV